MKNLQFLFFVWMFISAGIGLHAQESTRVFENGNDKLFVYSDVPGLEQPGEYYKIRVRSNASNNEWQECFVLVTRSLYEYSPENYFSLLEGWTHSYANIEMNSTVEVEIAKADGSPITKAAVHPTAKGSAVSITDGKAYFTMDKPALIAVDIDGQMDDHDTGRGPGAVLYDGPPIHAVSIFAHPIFEKPDSTLASIKVVHPGESPPTDPGSFNTLYFAPGVHNIGKDYQVYKNKEYFIPGDAIVYGTFGNHDQDNGMNIHIFGVGTISGDSLKHPKFDPDFPGYPTADADPISGRPWKPISIIDADYTVVEGVCLANPAFHALSLPTNINDKKVTTVRWAKVISWRGNGDGFGNPHVVEDCFLRTQDDSFYAKGDRRRCVIWNDANGAAFVMSGIPDGFPIVIEDCDIIYSRASWHLWSGGRVFSGRPISGEGNKKVNVLFRDIRIEDKRPTLQIFYVLSKNDISSSLLGNPIDEIGQSWSGIKFQNIISAGKSVVEHPEIFHGCTESPYSDWTFENFVIDGKLFTSLDDFAEVNEYVTDITFNPGIVDDATLFDIQVDGVSLPEFDPAIEDYNLDLSFGTEDVPHITATRADYAATISISEASSLPGQTTITVTAEDEVTTKTYTLHFSVGKDELISFTAPEVVKQGDTIKTTVEYSAMEERDLRVFFQLNSPPWDNYGGHTIQVPAGTGTVEIDLVIGLDVPVAANAYKTVANLLPLGGGWPDRLDEIILKNRSVISRYSNDASLSDITLDGISLPDFSPGKTNYDIILPAGTIDVPVVDATGSDENARVVINPAQSLPGTTNVMVTAEDSLTTQTYTVSFSIENISGVIAPGSVMQGEVISVSVSYAAAESRDILVRLEESDSPGTSYGEATVPVNMGIGTSNIDFIVDAGIPVATDAYTLSVGLLPERGVWADRLDEYTQENIDAVAPPSDDATLSGLSVNDSPVNGFNAGITEYDVELPAGTVDVPIVEAFKTDTNATVDITPANNLPGSTFVMVTAEDGETTLTYTLNFTLAIPDEITSFIAPDQVSPNNTITVTVSYSAYANRDLLVTIHPTADPSTRYGENTANVDSGTGTIEIEIFVGNDIPIATDAYTITVLLLPEGGIASQAFDSSNLVDVDAIPATGMKDRFTAPMDAISVYPNPFTEELWIEIFANEEVVIYNITGKIMYYYRPDSPKILHLSTRLWQPGIFVLKTASGKVYKLAKN